jgi:hypothetical protein
MKLLWYADFISYKRKGISVTGLVYVHNDMGALPVGHYDINNLEWVKHKDTYYDETDSFSYLFLPCKEVDLKVLDPESIEILDEVVDKFGTYSTKRIVSYMHKEEAYLRTKDKDIISYEFANSLREF